MRRSLKVKAASAHVPLRKAAMSASAAARRGFPAWIDSGDGAAFPATLVTPRVRDALVLRTVSRKKSANQRSASDGPAAR